jgi:hypothetical protein
MTGPAWPFALDVNVEVEPYSNLLIGGAILYTFVYLQMPGRCRLPSTFNLAVLILFVYGVFLNFASQRMTHSLERHTAKLHYGLPSLQVQKPRYRKPKIKKIGPLTEAGTSQQKKLESLSFAEKHILSLADMKPILPPVDIHHEDDPPEKPVVMHHVEEPPERNVDIHHEDDPPERNDDMHHVEEPPEKPVVMHHMDKDETTELPALYDQIRQEWFQVMQTNPMYRTIPQTPLRVALITRDLKAGPTNHVLIDGLHNSEHLKLVGTCLILKKGGCELSATDPNIDLWLIDANGIKTKAQPDDLVHQLLDIPNPNFQMLFVDYSDRLVPRAGFMKNHYPDLPYSKFQQNHIRFALRCIVRYD